MPEEPLGEPFGATEGHARRLDDGDALSPFREEFYLEEGSVYLDGPCT